MTIVRFLQKYILNFFLWWYLIKGKEVAQNIWRFLVYAFIYLNIWPMLSNLFTPMFQDKSWTGRLVAFPVRLLWGLGGLAVQLVLVVAGLMLLLAYFILPILPIIELIYYIA